MLSLNAALILVATIGGTSAALIRTSPDARDYPIASNQSSDATLDPGTNITRRAIVPDQCRGSVDVPSTLPTLSYYCNLLPETCANIRAHPDFSNDEMDLTYDPSGTGSRRNGICDRATKDRFQDDGKCDLKYHDPVWWKVSCDEFPFNSVLEGGRRNAHVMAVPTREQQFQGPLLSSITNLRRVASDANSRWRNGRTCHRYKLKLLDQPENGASAKAVGSLDPGAAFWTTGTHERRFITHRLADEVPTPFATDTDSLPRRAASSNPPPPRRDTDTSSGRARAPELALKAENEEMPTPTKPPMGIATDADFDLEKRQRRPSSCPRSSSTRRATSTAEATRAAAQDIDAAKDAAAAAAAALAAAHNAPAAAAAAASVAVSAADALAPAASALTSASSNSALASAIASAEAAAQAAQDAAAAIWNLGPDVPDEISEVADNVIAASSSIANAVDDATNVLPPDVSIPWSSEAPVPHSPGPSSKPNAPGHSSSAPGHSSSAPGPSSSAPGHSSSAHGHSSSAHSQSSSSRGHSSSAVPSSSSRHHSSSAIPSSSSRHHSSSAVPSSSSRGHSSSPAPSSSRHHSSSAAPSSSSRHHSSSRAASSSSSARPSPSGLPPAKCYGAGSKGFVKINDSFFTNNNEKAPAVLVDVGSDALFGLTLVTNRALAQSEGCPGVYAWDDVPLAPNFRVDCDTMALGSYWKEEKQKCYRYQESNGVFHVVCGNDLDDLSSCLRGAGLNGELVAANIVWVPS
ncbi:hypothetical protein C8Q80DRAFT_1120148 [Daedaleopsis nitida]|nr:hypothetical protein C8Q80DRAFT_1120148 [Daedaleopsis nitida]